MQKLPPPHLRRLQLAGVAGMCVAVILQVLHLASGWGGTWSYWIELPLQLFFIYTTLLTIRWTRRPENS